MPLQERHDGGGLGVGDAVEQDADHALLQLRLARGIADDFGEGGERLDAAVGVEEAQLLEFAAADGQLGEGGVERRLLDDGRLADDGEGGAADDEALAGRQDGLLDLGALEVDGVARRPGLDGLADGEFFLVPAQHGVDAGDVNVPVGGPVGGVRPRHSSERDFFALGQGMAPPLR